jgi:hypothetical protein
MSMACKAQISEIVPVIQCLGSSSVQIQRELNLELTVTWDWILVFRELVPA